MESVLSYDDEEELLKNHDITSLLFKKFRLNIWSNKEIVLKIVKYDGYYLKYVDKKFMRDKRVVYESVKNYNRGSNEIFDYVDEELKNDKEFILKLIKEGYESIYPYINEELKMDRDYTLKLLRSNNYLFKYLDDEYKRDEEMTREALKDLDNIWLSENIDTIKKTFEIRTNKYDDLSYYNIYLLLITILKNLFDEKILIQKRIKINKIDYSYYIINTKIFEQHINSIKNADN
jgi:hypothetical protein